MLRLWDGRRASARPVRPGSAWAWPTVPLPSSYREMRKGPAEHERSTGPSPGVSRQEAPRDYSAAAGSTGMPGPKVVATVSREM